MPKRVGIYHKVSPGETIWRIAKIYGVSVDEITSSNNIPDAAYVEKNQLLFIPGATEVRSLAVSTDDPNKDEFVWPLQGKILNYFGSQRGAYLRSGIGITAEVGQDVHASRQGKVVFSDYLAGFGYMIVLDHLDGFLSVYSQNSENVVTRGDHVAKGQTIAKVGKRGDIAFLHFEIRKNAIPTNPLFYLPRL